MNARATTRSRLAVLGLGHRVKARTRSARAAKASSRSQGLALPEATCVLLGLCGGVYREMGILGAESNAQPPLPLSQGKGVGKALLGPLRASEDSPRIRKNGL
jgi:hypothetical protein